MYCSEEVMVISHSIYYIICCYVQYKCILTIIIQKELFCQQNNL